MSGLVGRYARRGSVDVAEIARLARREDRRGPDARPSVALDGFACAIALHGASPVDPGVGRHGGWTVIVDGPLDNIRQLATELRGRGDDAGPATLVAQICSEVGFERGLARLEGGVAVVAWDEGARQLWLARDRTGLRTLHLVETDDGLAFATDPAALPPLPVADDDLRHFILLGCLPPPRSGLHRARALAPGELAVADGRGLRYARWWSPPANPPGNEGNRDRWDASVANAIRLAALRDLPADAILADGGGVASKHLAAQLPGVRTLSLDATGWSAGAFAEALPELWFPALIGDPATPAWWWLARAAADRGARSLVTGHGAAALFGVRRPTALSRNRGEPALAAYPGDPVDEVRREAEAYGGPSPSGDSRSTDLWRQRQLRVPEHDLRAVDVAAAAHGLVLRAPYAAALLTQVVAQVPIGLVTPRVLGRGLLARLAGDDRPHEAPAWPVGEWLLGAGVLDDTLVDRVAEHIAPDHVRALIRAQAAREADHGGRLWRLYALARWKDALAGSC